MVLLPFELLRIHWQRVFVKRWVMPWSPRAPIVPAVLRHRQPYRYVDPSDRVLTIFSLASRGGELVPARFVMEELDSGFDKASGYIRASLKTER